MIRRFLYLGALGVSLSVVLAGCAPAPAISPEPVKRSHCRPNFHTEGYPNNPDPRRAYGCRSDASGFIRRDEIDPLRPD